MPRLPYFLVGKRLGPFGVALTAWDLWRRIPPAHRKRIVKAAREHGPRLAARATQARRK